MLVFALIVVVSGEPTKDISLWQDLTRCQWFAERLRMQGTRYRHTTPVMAYCVPQYAAKNAKVHS